MGRRFTDALEVMHQRHAQAAPRLLEAIHHGIGHQHVLVQRNRVLQHAVDKDHVETYEFGVTLDPLLGHLPLMGDDLERQALQLRATRAVAAAVEREQVALRQERAMHLRQPLTHNETGVAVGCPEERGVALQLCQLQASASVDHGLQQSGHRQLCVGQVHAVPPQEVGVSADVGDQ